ncbi:hypothetical protein ZWY2020_024574, partial [Hordeum vulgare]
SNAAQHTLGLPTVRSSLPPIRFSAPGLYRPHATPPSRLGSRVGLHRRVSDGSRFACPSFLAGILHPYTWPSLQFPIHHDRHHQGIFHGVVEDAMDMQLLKVLSCPLKGSIWLARGGVNRQRPLFK